MSLTVPRHAGPDEPAHLVRSAGLVRGQILGSSPAENGFAEHPSGGAGRVFDVPSWVSEPDVSCFAFRSEVPAVCASVRPTGEGNTLQLSTAASYPPWPHIVSGLPTLLPLGAELHYASRLLQGALLTLVLTWALAWRARHGGFTGVFPLALSVSPAALWILSVSNPSAYVVVGVAALVAALPELVRGVESAVPLAVVGSAMMLLSRNDGVAWWLVALGLCTLVWGRDLVGGRRSFSTVWLIVGGGVGVVTVSWYLVERPKLVHIPTSERGWDLAALVLNRTSVHLDEAVGLVSWADTSVTVVTLYAWWGLVAAAATIAWLSGRKLGVRALGASLGVFVAAAWAADFIGARSVGLVWQGRYALPALMAGVALLGVSGKSESIGTVGGSPDVRVANAERLSSTLLAIEALVLLTAAWQMFRRWSVGSTGTPFPWEWDRGASALHPAASLVLYAVGLAITGIGLRGLVKVRSEQLSGPPASKRVATRTGRPRRQ